MREQLSRSARKVQQALEALGVDCQIIELSASTRTAREAAATIGCQVVQIAKSLVFKGLETQEPILVIASGVNKVNQKRLGDYVNQSVALADADFVHRRTGYAIGGVPPIAHKEKLKTYIDQDLFELSEIWAAAGTSHAVFRLTPPDLLQITEGLIVTIK